MRPKYPGCYWCDNIVDDMGMIGLLCLDFPRCFILIRDSAAFEFSDYDSWVENIADIQWLDPSDSATDEQKEEIVVRLWNFSVEYDAENERMYYEGRDED